MKKRVLSVMLSALLVLCCCCCDTEQQRYMYTYVDVFDTVTEITIYSVSRESADSLAASLHEDLLQYHRLTDIYQEYPDLSNLCTVNRLAGVEPVTITEELMELLLLSRQISEESGGRFNICMGCLSSLWETYRRIGTEEPEKAALPTAQELAQAMAHIDSSSLVLDTENLTVAYLDPDMKLDVGAIAKGWAVQQVCDRARARGDSGFLISAGHNICTVGKKGNGEAWKVAVENPENSAQPLTVLTLYDASAVTSGGYQRYYTVAGKQYHHILDPITGYPGARYQMVTVICADSGIADALSTALFLMDHDSGEALATAYGAEALWLETDGTWNMTDGFQQ